MTLYLVLDRIQGGQRIQLINFVGTAHLNMKHSTNIPGSPSLHDKINLLKLTIELHGGYLYCSRGWSRWSFQGKMLRRASSLFVDCRAFWIKCCSGLVDCWVKSSELWEFPSDPVFTAKTKRKIKKKKSPEPFTRPFKSKDGEFEDTRRFNWLRAGKFQRVT